LFNYIGIFSISGGGEQYEKANDASLKKAAAALKLVYYGRFRGPEHGPAEGHAQQIRHQVDAA